MNEFLDNAREEYKRIDHLIYVSLKEYKNFLFRPGPGARTESA